MQAKLLALAVVLGAVLLETPVAAEFVVTHVHEVETNKVVEMKPPPPPIFRKEKPRYKDEHYRKAKLRLANSADLRSRSGYRDSYLSSLKVLHSEPRLWNISFTNLDKNLVLHDSEVIVSVDDHILPDEGYLKIFIDGTTVGKAYTNIVSIPWWGGAPWPPGAHVVKVSAFYRPKKQLCQENADGTPNLKKCVDLEIPPELACEREAKFYVSDGKPGRR